MSITNDRLQSTNPLSEKTGSHSELSHRLSDERRERAMSLVDIALESVNAYKATTRALRSLRDQIPLEGCTLFAFGKAALPMAQAALNEVKVKQGIVHCFESGKLGPLKLVRSAHPFPAPDAAERGEELLALARSLSAGEVALCLISGGGSSMLERPRDGISLEFILAESERMMKSGADIKTLNQRRRELSMIKGGGLSSALSPATVINVIISDTPGAPLETVASGPSLPADYTVIAADHLTMRDAVLKAAPELRPFEELMSGEARDLGRQFSQLKAGFVATGETTVTVRGHGRGGRNHELILGALDEWKLRGQGNGLLLSIGSDGIDGSSDAAGAWCDERLLSRAPSPERALMENNSHQYFNSLGAQIITGPTGTNVADLVISLP